MNDSSTIGRRPGLEQPVEDRVDALEVVDRLTVALAVDAEAVVEDRVGPDHLGAELGADDPERLGQLVADVVAARALTTQQQGEMLRADDRAPRTLDRAHVGAASTSTLTRAVDRRRPGEPSTGADRRPDRRSIDGTAATAYQATGLRRPGRVRIGRMRARPADRPARWSIACHGPSGAVARWTR